MTVCSEIHTNTQCGQNVELLNGKPFTKWNSLKKGLKQLKRKDVV